VRRSSGSQMGSKQMPLDRARIVRTCDEESIALRVPATGLIAEVEDRGEEVDLPIRVVKDLPMDIRCPAASFSGAVKVL
jgi:hypothetical protein